MFSPISAPRFLVDVFSFVVHAKFEFGVLVPEEFRWKIFLGEVLHLLCLCLICMVIGGKVYVAWKRKMLHDVIGGHQEYMFMKRFMAHRILQLAKTTRG